MRKEVLRNISLALLTASTLGSPDSPQKVTVRSSIGAQSEISLDTPPPVISIIKGEENPKNIMEQLIAPFWREAQKRREERLRVDPEFNFRIDWELGENRLNFLLLGFGETHEPPLTERAFIGSLTIVSFDMTSSPLSLDLISFTHDIRAPEIERYKKESGTWDGNPIKIYRAYDDGGFTLMRLVVENASGLPIDFQLVFEDSSLKKLIDDVFEGIDVEVPMTFSVSPFYLEGQKYGEGNFEKGREKMSGTRVLQFIKTVPKTRGPAYPKVLEHNFRKHLFLKGLASELREDMVNPLFLWRAFQFLRNETNEKRISSDFELRSLIINNLAEVARGVGDIVTNQEGQLFSEIRKSIYIVDSAHGDGGVQWINSSRNPIIRRELQQGYYPDKAFAIPLNANPYTDDLITNYWYSVRDRIKVLLTR